MTTFAIGENDFLLDGEPFTVLSGAMHYFRIHPGDWADRIEKARLMGLNTIETYVPWNEHAPTQDEFRLDGQLDLARWLRLVHEAGLLAIVRPGPYICAEWDGGGLPAWLFRDGDVGVRRHEPRYLKAVEGFLGAILPVVADAQVTRGGPVIAVQVENEYGAFGSDAGYLRELVRMNRDAGIDVPLLTVDQPPDLAAGGLPELHRTASFGSRSTERLATLREQQPTGPLMCSEFWNGWFDRWGSHHTVADPAASAGELDDLLRAGASVNLYMFHGGTNFGFTNGANDKGTYQPTITSYDYDAPLDEAGDPTPKYHAFREVIARYAPVPEQAPAPARDRPTLEVRLGPAVDLLAATETLASWQPFDHLPTADEAGHFRGYLRYRTSLAEPLERATLLTFGEVRDRAQLVADGVPLAVASRESHERSVLVPAGTRTIELLVEDQGRVNYGRRIGEPKGLIGPALLGGVELRGWQVQGLPLDDVEGLLAHPSVPGAEAGPSLRAADFELDAPSDLFLDAGAFGKGVAWVNGFHLGRFWSKGPQRTLYVPGPVTVAGRNRVVVLDQHPTGSDRVAFVARPDLGHTEA